ncbi:SRPBCC domain-containing protein [Sinomonas flava]|uniref:Activator of Hsp90 ATPase homologue 1/2-like C-terminal domain-containing protein n=1 Tax=Sinomonas flava TaxID=496857 RepID=A0ABN3BZH4_9MICC
MEPLFSHSPRSEPDRAARGEAPPARVYRLELPVPRDVVYRAFVGDVHLWWPADLTRFGEGTHVFIEDGVVGEEGVNGETVVWAEVRHEEAGADIVFSWSEGAPAGSPTTVTVALEDASGHAAGGTVVTVTQAGSASGPGSDAQLDRSGDWRAILGRFAAFFGQLPAAVEELAGGGA